MTRLAEFMLKVAADTYPEPPSDLHSEITRRTLDEIIPMLPKAASVLDVGCGQGPALRVFREKQVDATGITLNDEDLKACAAIGLNAVKMDQNALNFANGVFDLVWARHVLEHSIAPYWTLHEFYRVLKPGGLLYVEVPAPETSARHETNRNHYSVLGQSAWVCLLDRSGFDSIECKTWQLGLVSGGTDIYWSFLMKKRPFCFTIKPQPCK
jgi:SAM-dependent methyltransferase